MKNRGGGLIIRREVGILGVRVRGVGNETPAHGIWCSFSISKKPPVWKRVTSVGHL